MPQAYTSRAVARRKHGIAASDPPEGQQPEIIPDYGYGYKILAVDSYGNLRSPSRNTLWPPYDGLSAPEQPLLHNSAGIYVTDSPTAHDLRHYNREPGGSSSRGGTQAVTCLAKCQIWGRCVRHANGYRAEHALPEEVWLQPDPGVPAQDLERLATSIRNKYAIDVQIQEYAQNFESPPPLPPPSQRFTQPPRERREYTVVTTQQELDKAVLDRAPNIRIEGGPISLTGNWSGSAANILVASGGDVTLQGGPKITAIGGTVTQYGGSVDARGTAHVVFMGGGLRAGADVTIEVMSPLQYGGNSRSTGGGQFYSNREGSIYLTRYFRGQIVDRSQPHAQALQQKLQDPNLDPETKKNIEGLLRQHKYLSKYATQVIARAHR